MFVFLIGVLLAAPICGAALLRTRVRRSIILSVCWTWLAIFVTWFGYGCILDLMGTSNTEFRNTIVAQTIQFGIPPISVLLPCCLTPFSLGLLSTVALVGIINSPRFQHSQEIFLTCISMASVALAVVTESIQVLLASWIVLDLIGGFLLPIRDSQAINQTRFIGQVLLRAVPSVFLVCAALHGDIHDELVHNSGIQIAALLRLGLLAWTHSGGQIDARPAGGDRQTTQRVSEPCDKSAMFVLMCYGIPAVSILGAIHSNVESSVAIGLTLIVVTAGYSALTNASRESSWLNYSQLAILAFAAISNTTNDPEFLIACHLPILYVLKELVRQRTVVASGVPILICILILVSGMWGQNQVFQDIINSVDAARFSGIARFFGATKPASVTRPILIGYVVGGFLYCAAITHWVTARKIGLDPNPTESPATKTRRTLLIVIGIVGIAVPILAMEPTFSSSYREDYLSFWMARNFDDAFGPTYLTPALGLGALLGWYLTHPARSMGAAIARWTGPVSNVARKGWYIRPILEHALAWPIQLFSFLAAQLDSRVVGGSSENSWKRSLADVGESLEGIQRLDIRYSTLCGVLAVVGVLLALWMGG